MKNSTKAILVIILLLIVIVPLMVVKPAHEGEEIFGGADGAAEELILETNPDYVPWFDNLFIPASGEIESLLFASQAALGAGIVGYGIGYMKRNYKKEEDEV